MPSVLRPDPFNAVLLNSEVLAVTEEQRMYIKQVLETASSDSLFADKAYRAIERILTAGPVVPPVVTSLNPASAAIGSPSFALHVMGTGFTPESVIVFNGGEEPTVFVSETELTTGVNMDTVGAAVDVTVAVLNDGNVLSDPSIFSFTEVVQQSTSRSTTKNTAPIQTAVKK